MARSLPPGWKLAVAVVLVLSLALLLRPAVSCADGAGATAVPAAATAVPMPLPTVNLDYGQYLTGQAAAPEPSIWSVLLSLAWKLGLVIALAYGLLWLMKRGMHVRRLNPGERMQLVETIGLGNNRSLHLLRVGSRSLLIGATGQELRMLADVTDAVAGQAQPEWSDDEATAILREVAAVSPTPAPLRGARAAIRNVRQLWNGQSAGQ